MSLLRRLPLFGRSRLLGGVGRAAAAALLLVASLATQAGTAPVMAAPILAAPAAVASLAPQDACTVVGNNLDNGTGHTLREAVLCATDGQTVTFAPGFTANQTITLTTGVIPITQSITIDGSNAPGLIVDAVNASRVFNITASGPVTLTQLVLQNGRAASGNGGAVLAGASPLVLNQVQVLSSTAPAGRGGGLFSGATATLTGTQFISNTSGSDAGGLWVDRNAVVTNGRFERNVCNGAACQGGGLNVDGLTLTGTQFISNTSAGQGGGAWADSAARLTNALLQGNKCTDSGCQGGGLYAYTTLTLSSTDFISNISTSNGGGAFAQGAALLTNGQFQGNKCTDSGCQGGGLYANTTLTLSSTDFVSNTSTSNGGGAFAFKAAALTNGSFQGNQCTGSGCLGGGIIVYSTTLVLDSSFSGNQSAGSGGAVGITNTAQITLANVTLSGNMASASGGGLYAGGASRAGLWNVTVAENQAPSGGGVRAEPGATLGITNTLFSNNGTDTCSGTIAAGTHNLEWPGPAACAAAGPTAGFTSADPLLAPLALNAPGTTLTHALLAGSPARDHGDPVSCANSLVNNLDQRGVNRPDAAGEVCDIGAYEAGPPDWLVFLPLVRK